MKAEEAKNAAVTAPDSTKPKINVPEATLPPERIVADALNEQGFLFATKIREKIQSNGGIKEDRQSAWRIEAQEYPVTAADGSQTRIDLVLKNTEQLGTKMILECKRANPAYKQWIFFDRCQNGLSEKRMFFVESFRCQSRPIRRSTEAIHSLQQQPEVHPCEIFNCYVESAVSRERGKSASATTTIEDAFRQVMKGQSGLMTKLISFEDGFSFKLLPVVVSTADMLEAFIKPEAVSIKDGMIQPDDVRLKRLQFCAVNYHADDKLALASEHAPQGRISIDRDLLSWQTRTIFIVQSASINYFLRWAHDQLIDI